MSDITKKYVDYAGLQEYDSQIKSVISTDFVGATSSSDGAAGRVPAPESGDENKYLRGDGTWAAAGAAGSVTGVKGDAETSYRDGDVNITKANIGLGNVGNFKAVSTEASQGLNSTEQSNARANIGAGTSNFDGAYGSLTGTPTLGTAAAKDVPASGNASTTQVVMGNDTRLSDARNAADVSAWAKASTKPTYTASEVGTYTSSEIDNMFSTLETNIDWKEAVATFNDITSTYPNPVDGWTVNVKDTDYTYRYNGSTWVAISANAIPEATTSVNGLMTITQVTKLNGIATGAEVNQNAFSNIKVGSTTVIADAKTDTLELVAGNNVTLTPDATNDKITIAATDTTYESKTAASGGTDVSLVTTGEKYTWNNKTSNTGTVTKVSTGVGLTGGDVTTTGTIKAKLRSETALTNDSAAATETSGRIYPVVPDKSGYLSVNVPWTDNNDNNAVTQTISSTNNADYRVLMSSTADDTTRTEGARKDTDFKYNPSTNVLSVKNIKGISYNDLIAGSGTAGEDKGSGVSPRYFPAKWTFNTGRAATDGDVITIKIPVAGHSYGVYVSTDNGSNYKPVVTNGTSRLTTQYGSGTYLQLMYEASASAASIYPVAGGDSSTTVSGGAWRVINFYDSNSNTVPSGYCETAAATQAKVATCTNYVLTAKTYLHVLIRYANTYNGKITLNVNGTGAKDIYINGSVSSSSNKTLPAGTYLVYYDDSKFYFRTDGKLTADITGNAANVTGTVAVANGGTGATTAANARINLGLGNVDNTSDADKPISSAAASEFSAIRSANSFNVIPYTAVKNTTVAGVTITNNRDGSYTFDGTSTTNFSVDLVSGNILTGAGASGYWSIPIAEPFHLAQSSAFKATLGNENASGIDLDMYFYDKDMTCTGTVIVESQIGIRTVSFPGPFSATDYVSYTLIIGNNVTFNEVTVSPAYWDAASSIAVPGTGAVTNAALFDYAKRYMKTTFMGTTAEWTALPDSSKSFYQIVILSDD